ncbi:MAG: transposase [Methylocella sp.]
MGASRRQFTDEFKRDAAGLPASSGRPSSQIARVLGIAASMLRAWRDAGGRGHAGPPRRSNTQAPAPYSGTDLASENARLRRENERLHGEREILKKRGASSRKRGDEISSYRGPARDLQVSRHVRLEAGCGASSNILFPAREGFATHGIEGSASALAYAGDRLTAERLTADLHYGNFQSLPFGGESMGFI